MRACWPVADIGEPASQTPREFAEQAANRIASACGDIQISQWARVIVQAFYEVRFGGGTLADDQAAAVETALQRLQQAARNGMMM